MNYSKFLPSIFILCFCHIQILSQPQTSRLLKNLLLSQPDTLLQKVLLHPEIYRFQIIYTQINRDKHNKPSFKNLYYNVDANSYFNPASTVKMPLAFLALEKLNKMNIDQVNKYTTMQFDSSYSNQTVEYKDSTAQNGLPSIAHFIKKAFLVSDNDAYNRLYEFIGQQTINRALHEKGYEEVRITRRFKRMTPDENRHTNSIRFIKSDGSLIYAQPPAYNTDSFDFSNINKIGKAHYDWNDSLINEPINFTTHNNISLEDLQQILQSVMFPSSVAQRQRFNLTEDDKLFLYQYLSQYPSETNYPKYDTAKFYDSYVKFFFKKGGHTIPSHIRVFNKVGWSYGFLTDVSYISDFKNKVEFMLSANIYVNSDGILNDDKYDYDSTGEPFLYAIGQAIYNYELHRKRKRIPDLKLFQIDYEQRNADDKRTSIIEVDN